jgi:glycosyltransferase involved in cell wall biosynthesis
MSKMQKSMKTTKIESSVDSLNKIVMIGPVYPYKGGIAHYTGLMCKNLKEKYDVDMISYKMQYPKILFKKEQRDYDNDAFKIENTNYLIHTANPFNWGGAAKTIVNMQPDLLIVQWWHPYFSPCYSSIIKKIRKKNIPVLFVCHNVFPHERFFMDKRLTRSVLKRGDYFIVQSKIDAQDLLSIKKDAKYEMAVHPTYNAFQFQNLSKMAARELLGIDQNEKILLFFGFVREYKGLRHLIGAMAQVVAKYKEAKLLVVGDFGDQKEEYERLIRESGVQEHICVYGGYIPDREVEKFFAACDLVVLPYESATQSGIVQIAYGFNKPVLVTDVGGLPEVVLDGKTGYVVPPKNPQAVANAAVRFFAENKAAIFEENVKKEAYKYSWDRMREAVEELTNL